MRKKKEFIWDTGWTMGLFGKLVQGVSGRFPAAPGSAGETSEPAIDIFEDRDNVVVEVEVPGMSPHELLVNVSDGRVIVEGVKKGEEDSGCLAYLCLERQFGAFRRVVPIPGSVDTSSVLALLRDGVLRIVIPRIRERRRVTVEVPVVRTTSTLGED